MKRMFATILAIATVFALLLVFPMSASADEPTVWSGKANIKWYLDGKAANAQEWHIKTAEDLAGLSWLVQAGNPEARYIGVYYDANYDVLGYQRTSDSAQKPYADTSRVYKPSANDGSQLVEGYDFQLQLVYLDADIVLNTGNAADWGETPPANVWQPIGGACSLAANEAGFNGIFEGEGHTISGAYFSAGESECFAVGLFGYAGKAGLSKFRNLTLVNSYFRGSHAVGTICGRSNNPITVTNCHIKDCITVSSAQGSGLIGAVFNGSATIENCCIENVSVTSTRYVGGFVGLSNGQTVVLKNCCITGTVTAATIDTPNETDPSIVTHQYGSEAGIIAGRVAGGAYNVENVWMAVTVNQLGKAEDQEGDILAQAGVIYAGRGNSGTYARLAIENIYYVDDFHAETVVGKDIEPLDPIDSSVVTLDDLTGASAAITLQGFDFENIWELSETGLPQLRFAKLLEADIAAREAANQGGDDEPEYNPTPVKPGKDTTTTAPVTTEEPDATTEPEKTKKKGCGSVIVGVPAIALIALAGVVVTRKKKEN